MRLTPKRRVAAQRLKGANMNALVNKLAKAR
jgi:hypothetical protein